MERNATISIRKCAHRLSERKSTETKCSLWHVEGTKRETKYKITL